jgi:hypothetical protein
MAERENEHLVSQHNTGRNCYKQRLSRLAQHDDLHDATDLWQQDDELFKSTSTKSTLH